MRGIVKGYYSPDIDDLWKFTPSDSDCFGFLLQINIGPDSEQGEESFDVTVVTPMWLISHQRIDDIILGRHYLIVCEYNFHTISEFVSSYVSRCTGNSWSEIANKIGRLGMWEFEDYQPQEIRGQQ